jgi:hypothetical protein
MYATHPYWAIVEIMHVNGSLIAQCFIIVLLVSQYACSYLVLCGLSNDAVSSSHDIALNERIRHDELKTGKNMEGSSNGLNTC